MNKYNKDLVKLIANHYNVNSREAEEYVDLFKNTAIFISPMFMRYTLF